MKSEKDKMLAGELYNASDPELTAERMYAKAKIHQYNQLYPSFIVGRTCIIRELFGSVGDQFNVEQPFYCDYGYNIHVGENFYANYGCTILDVAPVHIGDNVMLAPNVNIYTAGHPINAKERNSGLEFGHPVTIGNNVWIGGNVTILPGVTIGDNAVIGAGSVVTKDIPANVVAVGNPCKVVKDIQI
ncbi:sugar O-acetyltransferase [Chitinophagaceae bacterium LWZ2-11]